MFSRFFFVFSQNNLMQLMHFINVGRGFFFPSVIKMSVKQPFKSKDESQNTSTFHDNCVKGCMIQDEMLIPGSLSSVEA